MVVYIEREIFKGIDLESIKKAFQKKKKIEICNCQSLLDATNNKYTGITLYSNCVSCITFNILTLIFRY